MERTQLESGNCVSHFIAFQVITNIEVLVWPVVMQAGNYKQTTGAIRHVLHRPRFIETVAHQGR